MFYSKTWNTQLIYDNRAWFRTEYAQDRTRIVPLWHHKDYPDKYPAERTHRWTNAQAKAYWNSEKHYARMAMRRHETPEPYRKHRTSFRWD